MGVTIAFKGKLKSSDLVDDLIEDVADICQTNNWSYDIMNSEGPLLSMPPKITYDEDAESGMFKGISIEGKLGLKGISFKPHNKSETIELFFDTEGVVRSVLSVIFRENLRVKYPWIFVKTQFAGIEAHIKVINLLLYLRKKYFNKMIIRDDGGYYPAKDIEKLTLRMDTINNAIATLNDVFEHSEFKGTPDEIMNQVQDALNRSLKDVKIHVIRMGIGGFPENFKRPSDDSPENPDEELPF